MRRFICLLLLFAICMSCCASAEEDSLVGQTRSTVRAQWGEPVYMLIGMDVLCAEGKTLIAAYGYQPGQQGGFVQDYVLLDGERNYLSGTIPEEDTLFPVYDMISETPAAELPRVYDTGSGLVIHTMITADGYIVRWYDDCPNIITDMYIHVYDSIWQREVSGRMAEYMVYLIKKGAEAQASQIPPED